MESNTQSEETKPITYEEISRLFHLPITLATIELKISRKELKKEMKRLNIQRWPYTYRRDNRCISGKFSMFSDFVLEKKKDYQIQETKPLKIHKMKIQNLLN